MKKIIFSSENFVSTNTTYILTDRKKQTENMEKWQANRQIGRKIEIHTNVQTYRQTDRHLRHFVVNPDFKSRTFAENFSLKIKD